MIKYIESDLFRYSGKTDIKSFLITFFKYSAFRTLVCIRLCNEKGIYKIIGKIWWKIHRNSNIQIDWTTKIGYGLYIGHNGPIVVHPSTKIGNNVNLSQFTTIGTNEGEAAEIGDNVYIGPNVCIVDHVIIGNNVTIGAGSIVTKNIPENATVAGNYAKIINYNNPGRYIKNKYVR